MGTGCERATDPAVDARQPAGSCRVQPGRHRHETLPRRGVAGTYSRGGGRRGGTDPRQKDAQ
eukprot:3514257-Rhodomonas_salina.1